MLWSKTVPSPLSGQLQNYCEKTKQNKKQTSTLHLILWKLSCFCFRQKYKISLGTTSLVEMELSAILPHFRQALTNSNSTL